jgi:hypothetical protein
MTLPQIFNIKQQLLTTHSCLFTYFGINEPPNYIYVIFSLVMKHLKVNNLQTIPEGGLTFITQNL